jgi:VanZ family protein
MLWIAVFLLMNIIFSFSSQNADSSSDTSSGFAEFLAKIFHKDFSLLSDSKQELILNDCQYIVRKTAHFSIYLILGVLTLFASFYSSIKYYFISSPIICLAYAISDEIHQYFVPGRSCEGRDVCLDFFGSFCGIALSLLIIKIIKKHKKPIKINN